jgi:hypothetical protein
MFGSRGEGGEDGYRIRGQLLVMQLLKTKHFVPALQTQCCLLRMLLKDIGVPSVPVLNCRTHQNLHLIVLMLTI